MCQGYRNCSATHTTCPWRVYWIVEVRFDLPLAIPAKPFANYLPIRWTPSSGRLEGAENHAADAAPLRRARWRPPRGERGTEAVAGP